MGNLFRNKEGYMDRTAGEAIKRTDKTKKREGGNRHAVGVRWK